MLVINLLSLLLGFLISAFESDNAIEVSENIGKNIAVPHSYSTLGYSHRYALNEWNVIGVADVHYLNNSDFATNFGVGARNQNLELNVFYDAQINNHTQHQLGIGGGISSHGLEARCNVYLPLGKKTHILKSLRFDYQGGYIVKCFQKRTALSGLDIECGKLFDQIGSFFQVYGCVGGYGYRAKHMSDIYGVRARVNADFWDKLKADLTVTHDKVFKTSVQFSLSFYYGNKSLSFLRQELIVQEPKCYSWETNY